MRRVRSLLLVVAVAIGIVAAGACSRVPRDSFILETGHARLTDDEGKPRARVLALDEAQHDARIKVLREVEKIPLADDRLVGDHMARDPLVATRVQSYILSSRRADTRYLDDVVEVDIGVDANEVRRIAEERTE